MKPKYTTDNIVGTRKIMRNAKCFPLGRTPGFGKEGPPGSTGVPDIGRGNRLMRAINPCVSDLPFPADVLLKKLFTTYPNGHSRLLHLGASLQFSQPSERP
jgi:hypothetical protein